MNFKQFMKNTKAISPIFATLILIAIAVIAGVVVYMFVSGSLATMTGGGPAAQEKVSIQGLSIESGAIPVATVYAQSSTGTVLVDSALLKDSSGNIVATAAAAAIVNDPLGTGDNAEIGATLSTLTVTLTLPTGNTVDVGSAYTITLVSTKGGSFVSSSAVAT